MPITELPEPTMAIEVIRDRAQKMKHTVHVRQHSFTVDEPPSNGGEDLGVTPHDVYDSALGACKALTTLWYARRKQMPLDDIHVTVERDDHEERGGIYRLRVTLQLTGALTDAQRQELLTVAGKCPLHKLMAQATTEIVTELAPAAA
jgi:putative redox protein